MSSDDSSNIDITINGKSQRIASGQNVLELLEALDIASGRVAVEYNREILKKDLWESTILAAGDNLEIVHFVGGG